MQINFTGHGIQLTDALKQFTTSKMDKLLRHFDRILEINVTFNVENVNQIVEATIHAAKTKFHASASSTDMYGSIESLTDKLDKQISTYKGKIRTRQREE